MFLEQQISILEIYCILNASFVSKRDFFQKNSKEKNINPPKINVSVHK